MRPYLLAGLILLGFCAQDASASRLICNGEEIAGWLFYCDPEPEPEPAPEPQPEPVTKEQPAPPPPAPMTATEQMETFRKQADELKHRAILDPTPENVQSALQTLRTIAQGKYEEAVRNLERLGQAREQLAATTNAIFANAVADSGRTD